MMMMMMKLIKKLISLGELGQTTKQAQLQKYNKDVRTSRFSRSDTRFISRVWYSCLSEREICRGRVALLISVEKRV